MKIITYPNPILRQNTKELIKNDFNQKNLAAIAKKMIEIMKKNRGIGLAAPQVNLNLSFFVVNKQIKSIKNNLVLINPKIIERSIEKTKLEEGCLSLPGELITITRPAWVKVRALNLKQKEIELEAQGLLAHVLQHEIDHLHGKLIIDYKT